VNRLLLLQYDYNNFWCKNTYYTQKYVFILSLLDCCRWILNANTKGCIFRSFKTWSWDKYGDLLHLRIQMGKDITFWEFPIHTQLLLSAIVQPLPWGTRVRSFFVNFSRVTISCNNVPCTWHRSPISRSTHRRLEQKQSSKNLV